MEFENRPSFLNHIPQFDSIGLEEMNASNLQNRVDTKFLLAESDLNELIPHLMLNYQIVEIQKGRVFTYRSKYFDTQNFDLYHRHLRGFKNRHKVRIRNYVESSLFFFEVKVKHKGRTVKTRIRIPEFVSTINDDMKQFYHSQIGQRAVQIQEKAASEYRRFTLVSKNQSERVTIDFSMKFGLGPKSVLLPNQVIVELKQDGLNRNSEVFRLLKSKLIRPASLSKYCMGTALLNPDLKQNRLKKTLRNLYYQELDKYVF